MPTNQENLQALAEWRRVSYQELHQATNGFSGSKLLGVGSFGLVYQVTFSDGLSIAIKVFNLELEGAFKSFNIELNIMIDVASALEYLHQGYTTPVIHCDLKPSNVLLDEDMVAHLGDFGIAKLLSEEDSTIHTMTLATNGYMAPDNSFVSVSSCGNHANSTIPRLRALSFSPCNIHQFPSFLREWKNLTIDLHSNSLRGPVPTSAQSLQYLFITENELTGEIPSGFCNLTLPLVFDLSKNNLNGIIPKCLGNYTYLSVLDLRMNNFYCKIPRTCTAEGSLLRSLNLIDNQLDGSIPRSLVNCSYLEVLDLGNNLNGSFPHWLGVLYYLQILVMRSNKFHSQSNVATARKQNHLHQYLMKTIIMQKRLTGNLPWWAMDVDLWLA
ncbi:hypothetical protein CRYUN_Cryun39dG0078800 [Craigia yunnanensis]